MRGRTDQHTSGAHSLMSVKTSAMACATPDVSIAVEKAKANAMVTYTRQSMLSRACFPLKQPLRSIRPAVMIPAVNRLMYSGTASAAPLAICTERKAKSGS